MCSHFGDRCFDDLIQREDCHSNIADMVSTSMLKNSHEKVILSEINEKDEYIL